MPKLLAIQLVKHRLHLAEGMTVTASRGTTDPGLEPLDRLGFLPAPAKVCADMK